MGSKGTRTKHKRRQHLIDRKFQIPIAATMAIAGLLMMAYHLVVVHLIASGSRAGMVFETKSVLMMGPLVLLLVVALGYIGILVTHKVVGPAYRLRATMDSIAHGKYTIRANLRKGDALQDVADSFNAMADALAEREKDYEAALGKLEKELSAGMSAADAAKLVKSLRDKMGHVSASADDDGDKGD